jgi:hypothetical protein
LTKPSEPAQGEVQEERHRIGAQEIRRIAPVSERKGRPAPFAESRGKAA